MITPEDRMYEHQTQQFLAVELIQYIILHLLLLRLSLKEYI